MSKIDISNTQEILSEINIHNKYARYLDKKERRENWEEICDRYESMMAKKFPDIKKEIKEAMVYVRSKKILPSMRGLQFAGKAIELNPVRLFNCSAGLVDDYRIFGEAFFILLSGCGFGYSVQKSHVDKLPAIRKPIKQRRFLIADSVEGWAESVHHLMKAYFRGGIKPLFDYRDIRKKGTRLHTSGGKAPGFEPLKVCLEKIEEILIRKEDGEKIKPIEAHDIMCLLAEAVRSGGIRRAACISLFSFDDNEMLMSKSKFKINSWDYFYDEGGVNTLGEPIKVIQIHTDAKNKKYYDLNVNYVDPTYGNKNCVVSWVNKDDLDELEKNKILPWYYFYPYRGRANNSVSLVRSKLNEEVFNFLFEKIEESESGEPAFSLTHDKNYIWNPCHEIAIKCTPSSGAGSGGGNFCNLCEVNVSNIESQEDLNARVKFASRLATYQASFTDFHFLREGWKINAEKEALIGVSITGIADGEVFKYNLSESAKIVVEENKRVAEQIGINRAYRCTTVKPSGNSSVVLGTSSGIHARHSKYYLRRIRVGKNEAIYTYLSIHAPELLEDDINDKDVGIITIAIKSPENSLTRDESPIDLLERIKKVYSEWIKIGHVKGANTHNVSATISYKPDELKTIKKWMWENRDFYNGITLLPYDVRHYKQAPYENCTKKEYEEFVEAIRHLKLDLDGVIEVDDNTDLQGEVACQGGASCEVK